MDYLGRGFVVACSLVVAVGSGNVYWTTGGGVLTSASGAPVTLPQGTGWSGIAIDGTSVYWTDDGAGTVVKMALSGGAPVTLASGLDTPDSIALDAANVYFTEGSGPGQVMKMPLSGGTPVKLADDPLGPSGLEVDTTNVYWTENYYDKNGMSPLMRVSLAAGAPEMVALWGAVEGEGIAGYAVGATGVHFITAGSKATDYSDGRVMKLTPK